jgi:hypothetical protein
VVPSVAELALGFIAAAEARALINFAVDACAAGPTTLESLLVGADPYDS